MDKLLIFNALLYALCIFRELVVRIIQFFTGDPLDKVKPPYWFYAPYPESINALPVCVITGGNKGIGWETALNIARTGNIRVIITTRDVKNMDYIRNEFRTMTGNPNVEVLPLDLTSFASIKGFAEIIQQRELPIHILIHNAGTLANKSKLREVTEDGFEMSWQTNYLGPFYLTQLLLPSLKKATPSARIITVSSVAHVFGHVDMTDLAYLRQDFQFARAYADAKLAILLFTKELQRRLEKEDRNDMISVSLHPGLVSSEFYEQYLTKKWLLGFKSVEAGARTHTYLALASPAKLQKGGYYAECLSAPQKFEAMDHVIASLLWEETEKLISNRLAHIK